MRSTLAIGALLAVTLSGCGGSSSGRSSSNTIRSAPALTLALHGGQSATARGCGRTDHVRLYAGSTTIRFSGQVEPVPTGRWKVKLRIKVCRAGTYLSLTKVDATRDKHTGTFSGSLAPPAKGLYWARAALYIGGAQTAQSAKRHFSVR